MIETIFFWAQQSLGGYSYGPKESPDDQSFTEGIVRNDERLYPHFQLC